MQTLRANALRSGAGHSARRRVAARVRRTLSRGSRRHWIPGALLVGSCALALGLGTAQPASARGFAAFDAAVDEVERLVLTADFQGAIARAQRARDGARSLPRHREALERRARLEVLLASAQIALGRKADARKSMQRALYVWPLLSLDAKTTSPRVTRLLDEVRGGPAKGRSTAGKAASP